MTIGEYEQKRALLMHSIDELQKDLAALDRLFTRNLLVDTLMTRDEPLGGDDEDTAKSKGELLQQARDWVAAHPGYEFSSNALANYLNAKPGSVQNVIARLVDEGVLKVLVQGAGRRPSVYTANRSPS